MVDQLLEKVQDVVDMVFDRIPQRLPDTSRLNQVKVVSHRGRGSWTGEGFEENTLSAFQRALDSGVWGIECDLRWTADDVPVILHDTNANRVFGKDIELSTVSLESLKKQIPSIPTLDEVLSLLKGRAHLMLEVKDSPTAQQVKVLNNALAQWTPVKDYHLMSLNPEVLMELEDQPPRALVAIAELKRKRIHELTLKRHWGGYTGHYLLTGGRMLRVCQEAGVSCGTGFVNSENVLYREVSRGVNWVFTDQTDRIMKILSSNT